MTASGIIWAILLSIFGGHVVGGLAMTVMRFTVENRKPADIWKTSFSLLVLYVGGTERAIATILVLFVPKFLPAFIGGWMAFKIAANWGRHRAANDDSRADRSIRVGNLMALVGGAISFGIAILIGLYLNPGALEVWNAPLDAAG